MFHGDCLKKKEICSNTHRSIYFNQVHYESNELYLYSLLNLFLYARRGRPLEISLPLCNS